MSPHVLSPQPGVSGLPGVSAIPAPAPDPRIDSLVATVKQQSQMFNSVFEFIQQQQQQQLQQQQQKQLEQQQLEQQQLEQEQLKQQQSSRKRKASLPPPADEDTTAGFQTPEVEPPKEGDSGEDEGQEDEKEVNLLDQFSSAKKAFVPSEFQLEVWGQALQHDVSYGQNAWKTPNTSSILAKYTRDPSADAFTPPAPDRSLPRLVYHNQKEKEKFLLKVQASAGGMGAIATRLLGLLDGKD